MANIHFWYQCFIKTSSKNLVVRLVIFCHSKSLDSDIAAWPIVTPSMVFSRKILIASTMDDGSSGGTSIMLVPCCKRSSSDLDSVVIVGHP